MIVVEFDAFKITRILPDEVLQIVAQLADLRHKFIAGRLDLCAFDRTYVDRAQYIVGGHRVPVSPVRARGRRPPKWRCP